MRLWFESESWHVAATRLFRSTAQAILQERLSSQKTTVDNHQNINQLKLNVNWPTEHAEGIYDRRRNYSRSSVAAERQQRAQRGDSGKNRTVPCSNELWKQATSWVQKKEKHHRPRVAEWYAGK
jgi:hypothetical protein